jgi:hypothetical protein
MVVPAHKHYVFIKFLRTQPQNKTSQNSKTKAIANSNPKQAAQQNNQQANTGPKLKPHSHNKYHTYTTNSNG